MQLDDQSADGPKVGDAMKTEVSTNLTLFITLTAILVSALQPAALAEQPKSKTDLLAPMSIAELRQTLAESTAHPHSHHLMQQFAKVQLSERLNAATLHQLVASSPSPETAQALQYLADSSAFLDPPPDEVPALPRPDSTAQRTMVAKAIHYVAGTLPKLPNLLAIRITQHLVHFSAEAQSGPNNLVAGFSLQNVSRTQVTFLDGKETEGQIPMASQAVSGKQGKRRKKDKSETGAAPPSGLTSHGEFGPMLSVILLDAAKGKLHWARWETVEGKPAAVFRFAVDRSDSHFTVSPWQVPIMEFVGNPPKAPASAESPGSILDQLPDLLEGEVLAPEAPPIAYHGQLAVDPENGTILRIAVEADPRPEDATQLAKILVEYAPVTMGGIAYICPVHSIAISRSTQQTESTQVIPFAGPAAFQLNDVRFTDYRRFGSQATVVTAP